MSQLLVGIIIHVKMVSHNLRAPIMSEADSFG